MSYNQYGGKFMAPLQALADGNANGAFAGNPYGVPPAYGAYGAAPPGMNAPPGLGTYQAYIRNSGIIVWLTSFARRSSRNVCCAGNGGASRYAAS